MPGLYAPGEYDLAGFIVGAAERRALLTGKRIRAGDVLLGLPSSGLHTNGYSLARKLLFEVAGYAPASEVPELGGTVADALLQVHRSYLKPIRALADARPAAGRGAHHRRRHHRQHAAHAARREWRRRSIPARWTHAADFRSCCAGIGQHSRTTITGAPSTWASG